MHVSCQRYILLYIIYFLSVLLVKPVGFDVLSVKHRGRLEFGSALKATLIFESRLQELDKNKSNT